MTHNYQIEWMKIVGYLRHLIKSNVRVSLCVSCFKAAIYDGETRYDINGKKATLESVKQIGDKLIPNEQCS
jgi:hypothetical protein